MNFWWAALKTEGVKDRPAGCTKGWSGRLQKKAAFWLTLLCSPN